MLATSAISIATLAVAAVAALSAVGAAAFTYWGNRSMQRDQWKREARRSVYTDFLARVSLLVSDAAKYLGTRNKGGAAEDALGDVATTFEEVMRSYYEVDLTSPESVRAAAMGVRLKATDLASHVAEREPIAMVYDAREALREARRVFVIAAREDLDAPA